MFPRMLQTQVWKWTREQGEHFAAKVMIWMGKVHLLGALAVVGSWGPKPGSD